jgi:hypothetical protein
MTNRFSYFIESLTSAIRMQAIGCTRPSSSLSTPKRNNLTISFPLRNASGG